MNEEGRLLTYYMTLSCNEWGMRSLLHNIFFNADVYCNLVDAWLRSAFQIIDSIVDRGDYMLLVTVLAKRKPVLESLWLDAILIETAKSILQAIRAGQSTVNLHAAA